MSDEKLSTSHHGFVPDNELTEGERRLKAMRFAEPEPLLPSPSEPPFDREKQEAVHPDTVRLAVLLKNAFLCPTEDGELLGLFLSENEKSLAVLIVAEASDEEDGSFTAEDAPFLTDTQRNDLNGGVGAGAMKWASDPAVIRAAIDSVSSSLPTPEEQK